MGTLKLLNQLVLVTLLSLAVIQIQCAVEDLSQPDDRRPTLYRKTRDDRYYLNRYGSNQPNSGSGSGALASPDRRNLKPESSPEARDADATRDPAVEKRCIRCATSGYVDPYDYRDYDRGDRYPDRYDDRRGSYDDRYDYRATPHDRYDTRYDSRYENRYDRTPYERDRWYERRPEYDRGSYDRFDSRGGAGGIAGGYGGGAGAGYGSSAGAGYGGGDRYDSRGSVGGSAAYDYRGFGYDNRGYDNRGYDYRKAPHDSRGYRPWDETTRGSSGWDNSGRGYYFATGRPEPSAAGGSYGYDRGYASGYNYGGGGAGAGAGRGGDSWRDPYASRPRDPYAYDGYRGTSYLYERNPSPNTSTRPPPAKDGDAGSVTDRPDTNPNKSSDNAGSG